MLHGSGRTPAMEKSWRVWLEAHPENRAAWELATEVYADTGDLPAKASTHTGIDEESRSPWRAVATVALLALIALSVGWWGYSYKSAHTLLTALGEQRTLILEDGTRVELNTNSRIVERYNDRVRAVTLEAGEVYFKISPEPRPFVVYAGSRAILALGTEFVIRREDTEDTSLAVTLIEGKAAVVPVQSARAVPTAAVGGAKTLKPGQRLRLTRAGVLNIDTPSIDRETAWRHGRVVFEDTPLSEAIDELNRYNTVKLRLSSNVPDSLRVGGTFLTTDAENFADSVKAQYGLQLSRDSQGLILEASLP